MNRTLLTAVAMLTAAPALAGVSDPRFSSVDPGIVASRVMTTGFHVIVRTVDRSPNPNQLIRLDFSGTNVRLDAIQSPGITIDCVAHTASAPGNRMGEIDIALGFSGSGQEIPVDADGIVLGHIWARSTDFDGDGSTGLNDLAIFAPMYGQLNHPEADFDNSGGKVGLGDFAVFVREFGGGAKGTPCP